MQETTFETRSHIWKHGTSFSTFEKCGIAMNLFSTFFEQEYDSENQLPQLCILQWFLRWEAKQDLPREQTSTCWIEIQRLFYNIYHLLKTNAIYFFWLVFFGGTTTTLRRPRRFFLFFIFLPTTSFEGESTPFINERPKIWFSPSTFGGFECLASVKVTQIMNRRKERSSSCMLCVISVGGVGRWNESISETCVMQERQMRWMT